MMNKRLLLPVCISILLFFRCVSIFRTIKPDPTKPASVVLSEVYQHAIQMQTFQGVANLGVKSEDEVFQGLLHLKIRQPDTLWMKLEGPMSVDLIVGRIAKFDAQMYSPWENTVYTGDIRTMNESLMPVSFSLNNLCKAFSGLLYPDLSYADSVTAYDTDGKYYSVRFSTHDHLLISPRGPAVVRWQKEDNFGQPLWIWEAKSFRKSGPVYLPEKIKISQPLTRELVLLSFYKFKSNGSFKSKWSDIRLPESVTVIEL